MTQSRAGNRTTDPLPTVVVAGHLCLDIIPAFQQSTSAERSVIVPGHLIQVGPSIFATGGAVSNTGLALHRLGVRTRLVGMIGEDLFGKAILQILRERDLSLAEGIIVNPDTASSYTIVISPPQIDRSFLYCPGANDLFTAAHVSTDVLRDATLMHFGYPQLMRHMHLSDGDELHAILQRAHLAGAVTSLDMAHVDPNSSAGRVDWPCLLARVLPQVDILTTNLDELLSMFEPASNQSGERIGWQSDSQSSDRLGDLADHVLSMGAAMVVIKLGEQGIYFRSTQRPSSHSQRKTLALSDDWWARELLAPAFDVTVAGTTGAGDCAVAGFLAALVRGLAPAQALTIAAAVGAASVEQPDAISGVPSWPDLQLRLQSTWRRRTVDLDFTAWAWDALQAVWTSPRDHKK